MSSRKEKAKVPNMVSLQREYVNKYVNNNHPENTPVASPMDFSDLSMEQLRQYRLRYLNPSNQLSPDCRSFKGFLLENSVLGERTESQMVNSQRREEANYYEYRTKDDLRFNVEQHFREQLTGKESDIIMNLAYKVRNGEDKFRVHFDQK